MNKTIISVAIAALSLFPLFSGEASASDRYRKVAPVVVGNGLTDPWINQLGVQRRQVVRAPVSTGGAFNNQRRIVRYAAPEPQRLPGVRYAQPPRQNYVQPQRQNVALTRPQVKQPAKEKFDPKLMPQIVNYQSSDKPGSIVIDTNERFLYLVLGDGKARRYGVGVGKPGFEWAGTHKVTRKAEWPGWTPPQAMIKREAAKGHFLPAHMEGGPANPLGARALYLGSTEYRIHGTNAPWTIGYAVSSGCIRMRNEDVIDLYGRVNVGAKVTVI